KGMPALQIWRMMPPLRGDQGSYKTFWYMCQRLRCAMQDEGLLPLRGEVEVDEAYVGGESKNAHPGNRGKNTTAGPSRMKGKLLPPKTPVIGAVSRKGNVVAKVLHTVDAPSIKLFVKQTVADDVSLIATDQAPAYAKLPGTLGAAHQSVDHEKGEYV